MFNANFIEILKVKFLRNILIVSLITATTLLIFDTLLIYPSFTRMIIKSTEEEVGKIAGLMTHLLPDQVELKGDSISIDILHQLQELLKEFDLMKLQIFSKSGETLYSSDPKDIGTINKEIYFKEILETGIISHVVQKDTKSLEGSQVTIDVVETYVPIIKNNAVIGVFEIYYDFTEKKERLDQLLISSWAVLSILTVSLLGAVIVVLARAAQDFAKRRRAEEELRKARDVLELRVKERTAELVTTNEQLKQEIDVRKQMEDKMRKSRERFQALTESTSDWIWEMDIDGIYTYISPKVKDLLGYDPKEVIGKTQFDFMPPDEAKRIKSEFKAIFDSQEPFSKLEIVNIHKDGRLVTLESSGVPFYESAGRHCGYRGIDRDITEEQKLRQESEYRLQQVIRADKLISLGEVVAGVAHEINNPNSFITYNVPLLEETWQMFEPLVSEYAANHPEQRMSGLHIEELCGDMRELIQDIKTGSDRINKIVSNLKDFARLDESGQFKPVQVNEMIEKTMAIIGAQVRKSIGTIEMDLSPNLPKIQGHFQKLEQVMANLIMNAVHAIPEKDKGRLSVTTRHIERLGSVLIEVEDNGIGMEQGVMERIFEPFFTTRREAGGTGLGLSVSYGLIQEHNGIIGVLSRPGLGTRFTLYLPVDREKKTDLHPSILCIDDDAEFLGLLNLHIAQIRKIPMETIEKPNGIMEYLENHPEVDIVLSNADSKMFGSNGWKLIEKIKTRFPLISIILYSTDVNTVKQRPGRTPTPDHILKKPFKIEHLLDIINTIDRQSL